MTSKLKEKGEGEAKGHRLDRPDWPALGICQESLVSKEVQYFRIQAPRPPTQYDLPRVVSQLVVVTCGHRNSG